MSYQNRQVNMTPEECVDVCAVFQKKYARYAGDRYFETELVPLANGVQARIILRNASGSFYYPVESRIADIDHDMNRKEAAMFLFEAADSYFEEFFRESVYLPIDWAEFDVDGVPFQMKGQIFNLEAEKLADELLGEEGRDPTVDHLS